MKIKTMIVEDEKPARAELKYLLKQEDDFELLFEAADGDKALEIIAENDLDLIILDIQLPGKTGMEIANHLQKKAEQPYIIFTTAFDEHAVEAFKLAAVDYLLKPFSELRLKKSLQKAKKRILNSTSYEKQMQNVINMIEAKDRKKQVKKIAVIDGDCFLMLNFQDIYFFSTKDKKVWAQCYKKSYLTQFQLKGLEEILPDNFYRIHKSYIINLQNIKAVIPWFKGKYQIRMENYSETEIPVSRSRVDDINKLLNLK
ncbi:MAG: DNA-binding response regulator [Halanaerobium sp. MSAO_Bac5]|nr:MAG: DNA-binding response regulator [Halanaerobium sp. MSAO_Bac5]